MDSVFSPAREPENQDLYSSARAFLLHLEAD